MKADFERFKTFSTKEERDAFKKEMQAKYNALPEAQKEAYKKASESGLKATVDATVKKVAVTKGKVVDKNEVLIYLSEQ